MAHKDRVREKYRDIIQDAEGNYVYTGETYCSLHSPERTRAWLIGSVALIIAIVMGSGCIDAAGANKAFYVIMPFVGEVASVFVLAWNTVRVSAGGRNVRKYVLDAASSRIPGACRMLCVFAVAGLLMSVLYISQHGMEGQAAKCILYIVLKILAATMAEFYRKGFMSIEWVSSDR